MVSISEDCMVKLWDLKEFKKAKKSPVFPFFSIRDHYGPIFALTGN